MIINWSKWWIWWLYYITIEKNEEYSCISWLYDSPLAEQQNGASLRSWLEAAISHYFVTDWEVSAKQMWFLPNLHRSSRGFHIVSILHLPEIVPIGILRVDFFVITSTRVYNSTDARRSRRWRCGCSSHYSGHHISGCLLQCSCYLLYWL